MRIERLPKDFPRLLPNDAARRLPGHALRLNPEKEIRFIQQCMDQINTYSKDQKHYLLTSDLGSKNGLRSRSHFSFLDRLWAWISGVGVGKDQVVGKIINIFQGLSIKGPISDLSSFEIQKLETFSENIKGLKNEFYGEENKEGEALLGIATEIDQYLQQLERPKPEKLVD